MSSSLEIDRRIAELAATYNGIIPTAELLNHGHCAEAIRNRVAIGALTELFPGIRIASGAEITPVRRALAAALITPGAWVSHTSALAIHRATLRSGPTLSEVSSPNQIRLRAVLAHRHANPGSANLGEHFCIPVSRPWQAVIESAAVLSADELAVAMDSLLQNKSLSLKRLERAMSEAGWFRNRKSLHQLLEDRLNGHGLVRGFLEQDLSKLLRKSGLPIPVRNYRFRLPNGKTREIDTSWPNVKLGLEAQSWQYHSNPSQWGRTMIRDRGLQAIGWKILPVVVADVRDPRDLLADLRSVLVCAMAAG